MAVILIGKMRHEEFGKLVIRIDLEGERNQQGLQLYFEEFRFGDSGEHPH